MGLVDFIMMQNREMVESARISFKLLLPLKYGAKWFFHCNTGDTVEDLCNFVRKNNLNIPLTWPYNKVDVEVTDYDENENPVYKYTFDFNDFPEDGNLMEYDQ